MTIDISYILFILIILVVMHTILKPFFDEYEYNKFSKRWFKERKRMKNHIEQLEDVLYEKNKQPFDIHHTCSQDNTTTNDKNTQHSIFDMAKSGFITAIIIILLQRLLYGKQHMYHNTETTRYDKPINVVPENIETPTTI